MGTLSEVLKLRGGGEGRTPPDDQPRELVNDHLTGAKTAKARRVLDGELELLSNR